MRTNQVLFRSDQYPFLQHDIPAVWWFTGFHPDYHQVTDTVEKINFEKMVKILKLAYARGLRIRRFPQRAQTRRKGGRQAMTVRAAEPHEAGEIVRVINAAFNPAESFFVDGDRIDLEQVRHYFAKGVFLVTEGMAGCVYVELRGERAYFGLLSVDPARQKGGDRQGADRRRGRLRARAWLLCMDIRTVNLRVELPAFYRKLGYQEAGTEEFTPGSPTKLPCHFVKMEKALV